ncbi:MAG: hypothetical protein IKD05_06300 [Tidjanibacter sp.]|nr:hypothetical protein [Tidjanibacter sp.]MBR7129867.1 hypothetical protein [Tidjanibacter sp.]
MKTVKFRWLCAVAAMAMAAFGCKEPGVNNGPGRVPDGDEDGGTTGNKKEFVIYDGLYHEGKPDLQDDMVSPFSLIYEAFLVTNDELDMDKINQQINICKLTGVKTISLDIECWYDKKDFSYIKEQLSIVFNMFKEAIPDCTIGNYGAPASNLNVYRGYRPTWTEEEIMAGWTKLNNEGRIGVGEVCDVLYPSLYAYSSDMDQWVEDLKTTVAYIRQHYPEKKIVGYIWSNYYNHTSNPEYMQFVTREKAAVMLEACYQYLDGIILWSNGKDVDGTSDVAWNDPRVQEFYGAVKDLINKHWDNIVVEKAKTSTLEAREPSEFQVFDATKYSNKPADMRTYGMSPINYIEYRNVSVPEIYNDIYEPDYDKLAHVAKNVKNFTVFSQGSWIVDRNSANIIMVNRFDKINETFKANNSETVLGFGGVGPTALTQIQGQYHYKTEFARKDSWLRYAVEPTRVLRQYADVLVPVVNMIDDDLDYWRNDCLQVFEEAMWNDNTKKVYALISTSYSGDKSHPETFEGCGQTIKEETFLAGLEHLWQYCDGVIIVGGSGNWDENNAIVKAIKTFYANHKSVIDKTLPAEYKVDVIPEYTPDGEGDGGEGGEGGDAGEGDSTGNLLVNGDFEADLTVYSNSPTIHNAAPNRLPRVRSYTDPQYQTSQPVLAATLVEDGQWFCRTYLNGHHPTYAYIDEPEQYYTNATSAARGKRSLAMYLLDGLTKDRFDQFKHYTNDNMRHVQASGQRLSLDDTKTYTLSFWYYCPSKTWQNKDNNATTLVAGVVSLQGANIYTDYTYEEVIPIAKKDEWVEYTMTLDLPKIIEANPGKTFENSKAVIFFNMQPEVDNNITSVRCQVNIDDVSLTQN